ncbi:MAG: hypothetical protein K0S11_215 [Gammaproteobacteria bacterium]|jgi:thioesterase domain-containing protein|nr:hypothetical protein [Gammaproteobacteria bacterium]
MPLLIDLNPKENRYKQPLIFVADLLGSEVSFSHLAAVYDQLDPERFIYGLRSPFLEQNEKDPQSIEELASMYIDVLVKSYPYNNYFLCGYSFGGLVALEMAKQLQAKKKQIVFFGCIDTDLTTHLADLNEYQAARQLLKMAKLLIHKFNLTKANLPTTKELSQKDKASQIISLFTLLSEACEQVHGNSSRILKNALITLETVRKNLLLSCKYKLEASLERMTVFAARQEQHQEENLGWNKITKEISVDFFDADHFSILMDETIANKLGYSLLFHVNVNEAKYAMDGFAKHNLLMLEVARDGTTYLFNHLIQNSTVTELDAKKEVVPKVKELKGLATRFAQLRQEYHGFLQSLLNIDQRYQKQDSPEEEDNADEQSKLNL